MAYTGRRLGGVGVALGTVAWAAWLAGRLTHASVHPLWVVLFVSELLGVITGAVVAIVVARRPVAIGGHPCPSATRGRGDGTDADRYPTAVAGLLGIASGPDLRESVRGAWRPAFAPDTPIADRALALVRLDGTRRLVMIVALASSLLLGVAPLDRPTPWLLGVGGAGLVLTSIGSMLLTGGVIRPGDRLRWSFASIGLAVGPPERSDGMPVRWAGVTGSIVVLNLAVALRGLSDRWTHGLPPMADADRVVAMSAALLLVVSGLATLRKLTPPEPGRHTTRRLEERSARQSALGATAIAGILGLLAGILPGSVDAADRQPTDREQRPQVQLVVDEVDPHATEVGNRLVDSTQMTPQRADEP
ncbi:MAG TPA: hypothetical protein VNO51_15985 [Ilumatobacteraceae bacterium]|nr:hypothetical protein [Ilumatobacteraceae bacterium]